MTLPTVLARAGAVPAAILLLGACGGPSLDSYDKPTACGVDTELVTAVLGTDELETDERGTLPLQADQVRTSRWSCDVDLADRDDVLSVVAKIGSPDDIAARTEFVDAAPEQLEAAGGKAGIKPDGNSFSAQWVCGSTAVYLSASPSEKTTKKDRAALVTALAEAAGCSS